MDNTLTPGAEYRHYKGGQYKLLALAKEEATQRPVAVYQCLKTGHVWTRPVEEFAPPRFCRHPSG